MMFCVVYLHTCTHSVAALHAYTPNVIKYFVTTLYTQVVYVKAGAYVVSFVLIYHVNMNIS